MTRHHSDVPKPYSTMRNTQPTNEITLEQGRALYVSNCTSCHGTSGLGDGVAGIQLSPSPANLKSTVQMPMFGDEYLMWSISEGGIKYKTSMPAFKNALSIDERWKIINFLKTL